MVVIDTFISTNQGVKLEYMDPAGGFYMINVIRDGDYLIPINGINSPLVAYIY